MNRAGEGGRVARLDHAGAEAILAQLAAYGDLGDGHANVIALNAIATQMGRRWQLRHEIVHEHLRRALERRLNVNDLVQALSDTDFLVFQPSTQPLTAQVVCLSALRETLEHFLGRANVADIVVHTVTRVTSNGVYGERINVTQVESDEARERAREVAAGARLLAPGRWSPFTTADGRHVRVSCALEPVVRLSTSEPIGYRLGRKVVETSSGRIMPDAERRDLLRSDIERVDFATLARGIDRLRSDAGDARRPSLILPCSFVTLSSNRSRSVVIDLFREAQSVVRLGVICEFGDIGGVPLSALHSALTFIRPHCLFVLGALDSPIYQSVSSLRDAGLQGLSVACPPIAEHEFIVWVRSLVASSRRQVKSILIHGLPSLRYAAIAKTLGVTHGALRTPNMSD